MCSKIEFSIRFPPEETLEKGFCLIGQTQKDEIHCYGDSGGPAMYYTKSYGPWNSRSVEPSEKAYVIGIGYSYKDCAAGGPPTKFIKISREILNWLSQTANNIIEKNFEECNLGRWISSPPSHKWFITKTFFTLDLSISSQDDNIEVIEIPPESDDDSPDPKRPKKDEPNSGSSSSSNKKERKDSNTQPKKSSNVASTSNQGTKTAKKLKNRVKSGSKKDSMLKQKNNKKSNGKNDSKTKTSPDKKRKNGNNSNKKKITKKDKQWHLFSQR